MSAPTILVAGLGRCGSSLVMQMLAAAGVPTVGQYPDFEVTDVAKLLPGDPCRWLEHAVGKAVKVIDPHRGRPPAGPDYHTIWLRRDVNEQAKSMLKLIGLPDTRENRRQWSASVRRDMAPARRAVLASHGHGRPMLELTFEQLVIDPETTAREIADYVGRDLDHAAMAACVVSRSPRCLPYLLEVSLIAGVRAA